MAGGLNLAVAGDILTDNRVSICGTEDDMTRTWS